MVNKHTVDYYRLLRETESRIFLEFFLNLYIPPCFKVSNLWLRLLANTFVSQKIECLFLVMPPSNSAASFYHYSPPRPGKRKLPIPPEQHFLKIYFSSGKRGERIMELKKLLKLNLRGYCRQVLINSAIFATFTFLVFVLLCHNLASSMLKCEGLI